MEMGVGKISDGIQAAIDLLESVPVKGSDLETTGLGIMTALRNLRIIKDAVLRAERGDPFEENKSKAELGIEFDDAEPTEEAGESE